MSALAGSIAKKQLVVNANQMLAQIRKIASSHGLQEPLWTTLIGLADVQVAMHICNKRDESRGNFASLAHIGHNFCVNLASTLNTSVTSPWQPVDTTDPKAKPSAKVAPGAGVKVFDHMGVWGNSVEAVTTIGFVPDARVANAKTKESYTIKAVNADGII